MGTTILRQTRAELGGGGLLFSDAGADAVEFHGIWRDSGAFKAPRRKLVQVIPLRRRTLRRLRACWIISREKEKDPKDPSSHFLDWINVLLYEC
jgi:hypothetical protein